MGHVGGGIGEAPRDDLPGVGRAPRQPLGERRPGGRQDEDAHALRHGAPYLLRALPVDLQDDVAPRPQLLLDERTRGAVVVVEHPGVLEELPARDPLLELRHRDEVVLASLGLGRTALARGVRDRQAERRVAREQRLHQRGLARPGGGGDDEQPAGLHGAGGHASLRRWGRASWCGNIALLPEHRDELAQRLSAVAHGVLLRRVELGGRAGAPLGNEHRVVAEAAEAAG